MTDLGLGFDCASKHEINLVKNSLKGNVNKTALNNRIIFANTIKTVSDLRYAKSIGIKMLTFDNIHELIKIKREHENAVCILSSVWENAFI